MTQPRGPEPQAPNPDAGVAFRAEMWLTNVFLGYWQVLVGVIVAGLLGILVYGQAGSYLQGQQRRAADEISKIELQAYESVLEAVEPELRPQVQMYSGNLPGLLILYQQEPMLELSEEQILPLGQAADELMTVAEGASGTAAMEAWLNASEYYRISGNTEGRRKALELASEASEGFWQRRKGPLRYAAQGGLANLELEAGNGDSAVARLRTLSDELDGYLAEQATLDLGLVLEHLGRGAEAQTVYASFQSRWPESPRLEEVEARLDRLQSGGAVPAAPEEALPSGLPDDLPALDEPEEEPVEELIEVEDPE